MKNKKIENIIIILIIVLIIVAPLIVINITYIKTIVINILDNKENAYQYMQFLGAFLGAIITVAGSIITVRYQIHKETKVQKYIERQSFIRNEIGQQIIRMKIKLKDLRAEVSAVEYSADWAINYENKEIFKGMNNDSNRIDVKNNFDTKFKMYLEEKNMFEILLENYEVELADFSSEFSDLKKSIDILNKKSLDIYMKISIFPQYTKEMMESLLVDTKDSYKLCNYIYELLDNLYKKLNRYFVEEFYK